MPRSFRRLVVTLLLPATLTLSCGDMSETETLPGDAMDAVAENYVKLVLQMGQHDPGYVDAYYGPDEWSAEAEQNPGTLDDARTTANNLLGQLAAISLSTDAEEIVHLRHNYLTRQLQSIISRIDMLEGVTYSFDDEASALYDAEPPSFSDEHFGAVVAEIETALPGDGPVHERYATFREAFVIPTEKLDAVFTAAIDACKERTTQYLELPASESFTVEYVEDKPWSGYNWYQGSSNSLIQVNTDLPIYIDRAIDLACHEGYPGHHIYNALLEKHLAVDRGWVEYSVYALFSPQSLIAEGTANYGIEMAFPGDERAQFEKEVLFPIAGLDASRVDEYYKLQELTSQLSYATNEAARAYLDGVRDADATVEWLGKYGLSSADRATQQVSFIDTYRSYVINYNLGKDLVAAYVEREAGENATHAERWEVFGALLSSPRLPSGLR